MADPFIAEIRIFAFNLVPHGWAQCNGQTLPIPQNTALFSLLGTTYGGDGKSTFALPDMAGRAALDAGQAPGLSLYNPGNDGGYYRVALWTGEMPRHTHIMMASGQPANQLAPASTRTLAASSGGTGYQSNTTENLTAMDLFVLDAAGGGNPHNNLQPSLALNFCIALQGIFPARPRPMEKP